MLNPLVRLVDDDTRLLKAQSFVLKLAGLEAVCYDSAEQFLAEDDTERPGCVVLDIRMAGISGLECQKRMIEAGIDLPILFLTGHGDVQMAVMALKSGAADFRQKPIEAEELVRACARLVDWNQKARERKAAASHARSLVEALTGRELEVAQLVAQGMVNKEIAARLGVTEQGVKFHRSNIYHKLGVRNALCVHDILSAASTGQQAGNDFLTLRVLPDES